MDQPPPIALITGAARRIGRQIALELAEHGCDIALHYHRSQSGAEALVPKIEHFGRRAVVLCADLADPDSWAMLIDRTVELLGGLTVLINNSAIYEPMSTETFDLDAWDRTMRVNLTAAAGLVHHARTHLQRGQPGRVVNLCDALTTADGPPVRGFLAYGAAKSALHWLTRAQARELAPSVLVNGVAPGVAVFPEGTNEPTRDRILAKVPLGRTGGARSVAQAVRFLVTEGSYITGHIITVDGGRSLE
ncbi:MAG: SDR family oxidoreductase [Planctomycetes bacterium]|nr:SDR family oxidoreductase [Planctomycetota bacterium]